MPNQNSKRAIARLYFPDAKPRSAEKHLMIWIKQCKGLMELLQAEGYKSCNKLFTPRQKELILNIWGIRKGSPNFFMFFRFFLRKFTKVQSESKKAVSLHCNSEGDASTGELLKLN